MAQPHGKYGRINEKQSRTFQNRNGYTERRFLVSVIIYNYNYGRYLSACFDSVINQSYQNIEILFSDNASTDDSWKIAKSYSQRLNLFFLARKRVILVVLLTKKIAYQHKRVYTIFQRRLIKPDYISKCVAQLEKHLDAAFVMVHRSILDEKALRLKKCHSMTITINYTHQAKLAYFMSPEPSITQVFYRTTSILKLGTRILNDLYFGHRFVDFKLCLDMPIIYREALIAHRIHGVSQS